MTPAEVATAENQAEDWIARTLAASADQPDDADAS